MDLNTLSAKELVKHFNALVTASHPAEACLTEWKASKATLIAKIKALPKEPVKVNREEILADTTAALKAQAAKDGGKVTKEMDAAMNSFGKGKKPAKTAKPAKEKPAKEKTARKGQSDPAISEYFAKHGLNPKIVRAKLRRAGFSAPYTLAQIEGLKKD